MVRIRISFPEHERSKVEMVVAAVKVILHDVRTYSPKPGKDGQFHMSVNTKG